jgi:transporter family protein
MPAWITYILISTLLAGVTAVFVKSSISEFNTEMGMVIRIAIVFVIVLLNLFVAKGYKEPFQASTKGIFFLILSGVTTGLCWVFYYKAIDTGNISMISVIERGSIVITLLLAVTFLGEPFTLRLGLGAGLILLGMIVLVWK